MLEANMEDATDVNLDMLNAKSRSVAAIELVNEAIMMKLASLTKALATLQGDMSWVREDPGMVHEVMEKIGEHVSMMGKNRNEADGVREEGALEATTWCTWKGEASATKYGDDRTTNHARKKNTSTTRGGKPRPWRARSGQLHPRDATSTHGQGYAHKHRKLSRGWRYKRLVQ